MLESKLNDFLRIVSAESYETILPVGPGLSLRTVKHANDRPLNFLGLHDIASGEERSSIILFESDLSLKSLADRFNCQSEMNAIYSKTVLVEKDLQKLAEIDRHSPAYQFNSRLMFLNTLSRSFSSEFAELAEEYVGLAVKVNRQAVDKFERIYGNFMMGRYFYDSSKKHRFWALVFDFLTFGYFQNRLSEYSEYLIQTYIAWKTIETACGILEQSLDSDYKLLSDTEWKDKYENLSKISQFYGNLRSHAKDERKRMDWLVENDIDIYCIRFKANSSGIKRIKEEIAGRMI